jgi:aminoglycoside phosphotransferase (APT) family kinase protein
MVALTDNKPTGRTIWFALLICGILLGLSLVPAVSQYIQALDLRAAYWLNRGAGVSPVLDRIVLLIADEDGRERLVALVFLWFIAALWMARGRVEKSRMLGMLLFVAAVLGIFFLIDALLDDVVERKSPSYTLQPFRSIGKILDFRVDLTDRRSFPSATGVILLTVGFLLARLGRMKGGLIGIALGLTVPLLQCIAGQNWVSDIYLGSLPVSILISAVAVETPFLRLLGIFVDLSAAGIDQMERFGRNLTPMWRHRTLYWVSQNVFHMEVAVKRFISREFAHVMDPDKRHRNEQISVEMPLGGLRSVVRVTTMGPIKAVVRAYPLNRRFEAEQHYRASNLLNRHGIRVPKIYHQTDSPKKFGALFLIEEFIDGRCKEPADLTHDDVTAAAIELARLHQVTSEVWGPVAAPRTEEYGTVLLRRIDRQLSQIERGAVLKGQQTNVAEVRAWFAKWRTELNEIRQFSLVHGKLHRENCIFESSGGFCLLDFTTLEWGIPSSDLVLVQHSQCGGNPETIGLFNDIYYGALRPEAREQGKRLEPLFNAIFSLGQVSKYTKRLGRSQKRQVGDAITKGTHWWHKLLEIVEV